jgi:hypothetical protein
VPNRAPGHRKVFRALVRLGPSHHLTISAPWRHRLYALEVTDELHHMYLAPAALWEAFDPPGVPLSRLP